MKEKEKRSKNENVLETARAEVIAKRNTSEFLDF